MCTNFPWFLATIFFTNHWWDLDPYNLFGFGLLLCLRKFNNCKILKCLFRSSDGKTGVDKLRYIKNSYNKYKPPSPILKYSALYFLWAVNHSAPPLPPQELTVVLLWFEAFSVGCGWWWRGVVREIPPRHHIPQPTLSSHLSSSLFSMLFTIVH